MEGQELHEKGGWLWWVGPLMANTCCSDHNWSDVTLASGITRNEVILKIIRNDYKNTNSTERGGTLGLEITTCADCIA